MASKLEQDTRGTALVNVIAALEAGSRRSTRQPAGSADAVRPGRRGESRWLAAQVGHALPARYPACPRSWDPRRHRGNGTMRIGLVVVNQHPPAENGIEGWKPCEERNRPPAAREPAVRRRALRGR